MIISNSTTGNIEFRRTFKSRKAVKNIMKNSIKIITSPNKICEKLETMGQRGYMLGSEDLVTFLGGNNNSLAAVPVHIIGGNICGIIGATAGVFVGTGLCFKNALYDPSKSAYKGMKNIVGASIKNERKLIFEAVKKVIDTEYPRSYINRFDDDNRELFYKFKKIIEKISSKDNLVGNEKNDLIIGLSLFCPFEKIAESLCANDNNKEAATQAIVNILNIGTPQEIDMIVQNRLTSKNIEKAERTKRYMNLPLAPSDVKKHITPDDVCSISCNGLSPDKTDEKITHPVALKGSDGYSLFELEALEDWQKECVRQKNPFVNPNTREVIDANNLSTPENEAKRILFRIDTNDFNAH